MRIAIAPMSSRTNEIHVWVERGAYEGAGSQLLRAVACP